MACGTAVRCGKSEVEGRKRMEGAVCHAPLCWHAGCVSHKMLWSSPASYQPPWGAACSLNLQAFPSNRDHL